MATKMDERWFAEGRKDAGESARTFVDALGHEVRRLESQCAKYEHALEKVATCKDDDHAVLKLLGTIAADALAGK